MTMKNRGEASKQEARSSGAAAAPRPHERSLSGPISSELVSRIFSDPVFYRYPVHYSIRGRAPNLSFGTLQAKRRGLSGRGIHCVEEMSASHDIMCIKNYQQWYYKIDTSHSTVRLTHPVSPSPFRMMYVSM